MGRHHGGNEPGARLGSGLIGSRKFGSSLRVRIWDGGEILGLVRGCRLPLQTSRPAKRVRGQSSDGESGTDVSRMSDGFVILVTICGDRAGVSGVLRRTGGRPVATSELSNRACC